VPDIITRRSPHFLSLLIIIIIIIIINSTSQQPFLYKAFTTNSLTIHPTTNSNPPTSDNMSATKPKTAPTTKPAAAPTQAAADKKLRKEIRDDHVGLIVQACGICRHDVRKELITKGYITAPAPAQAGQLDKPYSVDETRRGTSSEFRVPMSDPRDWAEDSLKMVCLKAIMLPFHATTRKENFLTCANFMK
jgi:hypothetical protein